MITPQKFIKILLSLMILIIASFIKNGLKKDNPEKSLNVW